MESLTIKEVYVIETLISAEHTSNNYHLPHWSEPYETAYQGDTWASECQFGGAKNGEKTDGKAFAAVCSSLVKKGFVAAGGRGADAVIGVTRAGWKAYQEWAAQHLKG